MTDLTWATPCESRRTTPLLRAGLRPWRIEVIDVLAVDLLQAEFGSVSASPVRPEHCSLAPDLGSMA